MLRKIYLSLVFLLAGVSTFAQTGALKGTVVDAKTNEPIPFAGVVAELSGSQAGSAQTDFDGNFTIKPLNPGKYNVKVVILGYAPKEITGVLVTSDKIEFLNVTLSATTVELKEFVVEAYKVPLISKDNTVSGSTITREDIAAAPTRDVAAIAATTAGVSQVDNGASLNVKGSRSDATVYYIDGIKVRGGAARGVPQAGVEQVEVITGGLPAQYGDVVGGVISITTRGPSKQFVGGAEVVTSEYLDNFGYNLIAANLSGPLYTKKGDNQPKLGFLIGGEFQYDKEPAPFASPMYKVKDEKLEYLRANPLFMLPQGALRNAEFITMNDLEQIKARQNVDRTTIRVNGKVDYKPSINTNLTFGGTFQRSHGKDFNLLRAMFSPSSNSEFIDNTYRVFGRFTQKFGTVTNQNESKAASTIKNAYYTIQVDYSRTGFVRQDEKHQDRIFESGYVGKFKTYKAPIYGFQKKQNASDPDTVEIVSLDLDTLYTFEPANLNPDAANYTKQVYAARGKIHNQTELILNQGLSNGFGPSNVYGLFLNTGEVFPQYQKSVNEQYRITAMGSADVKKHALTFGIEYEQRVERAYVVATRPLWNLMKLLANKHLRGVDKRSYELGTFGPYPLKIYKNREYIEEDQSTFDKNFRQSLGLAVNNTDWLDIDNYSPDAFKLDMFSANELLNQGSGYVNYYGYDYLGNKISAKQSFDKFFSDPLNRPIGAFQPNYIAGFIQDKFSFKDLIFNIGVRIDRYDANQKVLKDKYLLYEARTASDPLVGSLLAKGNMARPSNIGDDYVVYVDNYTNPTRVLGYRNEDQWYDASGTRIVDPSILSQNTTTINPYIIDPNAVQRKEITPNVFKDYEPPIIVMPRISFSFPISDEALFYAHYDILTQRPDPVVSRISPVQYYYIENSANAGVLLNPDLKPERTIDYELGFKQKLTNSSAITISAFYKEVKDQIQQGYIINAFPVNYQTYINRDFGTIKGLTFMYDLRRTTNIRLMTSYTLQFATGTGSSRNSTANLTPTDPEIRTPQYLDFDIRHMLSVSMDYRYESGTDYNGPLLFGYKIFEGTGLNVLVKANSGTPYTRIQNAVKTASFGERAGDSPNLGGINSARLPANFRIDLRLDRNIDLKFGRKGEDKKYAFLNVYILVQNVLDTRNVTSVYRYTGSPVDDGYLASAIGQNEVNNKFPSSQSYSDLYSVKQAAPGNGFGAYAQPRIIRVGAALNF